MPSPDYQSRSDLVDNRKFEFGSVWKIDDREKPNNLWAFIHT